MKNETTPQLSSTPEPGASQGYDQPVAYDAKGNPLYARPAAPQAAAPTPSSEPRAEGSSQPAQPQYVHLARPTEPVQQDVSEAVKAKHDESMRLYPHLNLSEAEYVISHVRRHFIGLVLPLGAGIVLIAAIFSVWFNISLITENVFLSNDVLTPSSIALPAFLLTLLVAIGMYIAYYVYVNNKFYLTNESVIQEIQMSLFSRLEQTVSLANIEDASYTQHGILQHLLNYGQIRLSTEGDETTYRFTYVAGPKNHISTLNNAVEAFKNGRPTDPN